MRSRRNGARRHWSARKPAPLRSAEMAIGSWRIMMLVILGRYGEAPDDLHALVDWA